MKLHCKILPENEIREKIKHLKDIDFSLFIESMPQSMGDLSDTNVLVLLEPNGYFGHCDWAIANQHLFSLILTWDQKVLNNCDNAVYLPFGHTWFKPNQYENNHSKKYMVSHLCGTLLKTYGQSLRHELIARKSEVNNIPTNFFETYGDRHNIEEARVGKEEVFANSQYGVAIENFSHRGYFSEKILDCFLLKTVPIYWGCSNIGDYFNTNGIIQVNNVDDIIFTLNSLNKRTYTKQFRDAVEDNYQRALNYVDYSQNIVDKITEVFTLNNIK